MNHLYKTDYKGIPLLYLFLRSPLLYNIVFLLVFSLFSGLLGACVLGLSFWLRKRKIILFLPLFFIIHVLDAINVKWLYMAFNGETSYVDTALLDYVVPSFSNGGMSPVFIGTVILILVGFIMISAAHATREDLISI